MLQRIQSVYLILVAGLMLLSLIFPLLSFTDGTLLNACGFIKDGLSLSIPYGIAVIGAISILLAFIEIFLFKNRKLQIKLGNINLVLILLYYVTIAVYTVVSSGNLNLTFSSVQIGLLFPVIALILNVLATSKIKADENLIRSMDRIR